MIYDLEAREVLNSVMDWVHGVCPCGNISPAECPVCGARIENPDSFCRMQNRKGLPEHLRNRISAFLAAPLAAVPGEAQTQEGGR